MGVPLLPGTEEFLHISFRKISEIWRLFIRFREIDGVGKRLSFPSSAHVWTPLFSAIVGLKKSPFRTGSMVDLDLIFITSTSHHRAKTVISSCWSKPHQNLEISLKFKCRGNGLDLRLDNGQKGSFVIVPLMLDVV
jgi:hypothetical protein